MTPDTPTGAVAIIRRFSTAIYAVCAIAILAPPTDIILSMEIFTPSSEMWRVGAVGLLTGAIVLPLIGLLVSLLTAHVSGHRVMQRTLVGLGGLGLLVLIVSLGMFMLDYTQIRGQIPADRLSRYDIGIVKSIILQIAQIMTVASMLWVSMRVGRTMPKVEDAPETKLVAGGGRQLAPRSS